MASDIDWQDKAQRWMALYERESAEYTRVALENVRLTALLAERDAAVARAERAEAARVDLVGLLDEFFHGEESAAFCERPGGLVCIDCGMAAREDVADIDHEDGCRVGALYAALAAASEGEG